ncbi:MAG: hypothetical protein HY600_06780, partial [Candidatus Omnitrophica bacterium]|nr:hypothetical protein [Candidatus Omnitrophota bacterium]
TAPTKPYRMLVGISNPGTDVAVDVYDALRLWRFGVTRSQITIVRWRLSDWNDMIGTSDSDTGGGGTGPPAAWMSPSPPMPFPRTVIYLWQYPGWLRNGSWIKITVPSMENGMIWNQILGSWPGPLSAILDVEVTW